MISLYFGVYYCHHHHLHHITDHNPYFYYYYYFIIIITQILQVAFCFILLCVSFLYSCSFCNRPLGCWVNEQKNKNWIELNWIELNWITLSFNHKFISWHFIQLRTELIFTTTSNCVIHRLLHMFRTDILPRILYQIQWFQRTTACFTSCSRCKEVFVFVSIHVMLTVDGTINLKWLKHWI
jgi:hypothetical protein